MQEGTNPYEPAKELYQQNRKDEAVPTWRIIFATVFFFFGAVLDAFSLLAISIALSPPSSRHPVLPFLILIVVGSLWIATSISIWKQRLGRALALGAGGFMIFALVVLYRVAGYRF